MLHLLKNVCGLSRYPYDSSHELPRHYTCPVVLVGLPVSPPSPWSLCRSSPSRRGLFHSPYDTSHELPRHYMCPVALVGSSVSPPSPVSVSFIPLKARFLPLSIRCPTRASSTLHVSGCLGGIARFPTFPLVSVSLIPFKARSLPLSIRHLTRASSTRHYVCPVPLLLILFSHFLSTRSISGNYDTMSSCLGWVRRCSLASRL